MNGKDVVAIVAIGGALAVLADAIYNHGKEIKQLKQGAAVSNFNQNRLDSEINKSNERIDDCASEVNRLGHRVEKIEQKDDDEESA